MTTAAEVNRPTFACPQCGEPNAPSDNQLRRPVSQLILTCRSCGDQFAVLAGGRVGRIIPADTAGMFRIEVDDDFHALRSAGASHDVLSLARHIARLWHASGMDTRARSASGGLGAGGCIEERIRDRPMSTANRLIAFAGNYAMQVRCVVIYDATSPGMLEGAILGLKNILDTAGSLLHEG